MEPAIASLLFVEDDPALSAFLLRFASDEGYAARGAHDGPSMRAAMEETAFDVIVLDIGLPGREDGYTLARALKTHFRGGLLFLSARPDPIDRIIGLEIGADDYLVKPFEPRELLARIRAVLRRLPPGAEPAAPPAAAAEPPLKASARPILRFDGWELDLGARALRDPAGRNRRLTAHEFTLLTVLATRPGRVLSRDQLLDFSASRDWTPFDRSIDVMIGKIRRKIGDNGPDHRVIRTIRGAGYMFAPPG